MPTTISITTKFGQWDETARQLRRYQMELSADDTVTIPNSQVRQLLIELWALTASNVILGFSISNVSITADQ